MYAILIGFENGDKFPFKRSEDRDVLINDLETMRDHLNVAGGFVVSDEDGTIINLSKVNYIRVIDETKLIEDRVKAMSQQKKDAIKRGRR